MICQHGQKLNKFCIAEKCKHPISAGCAYCFKKNHFHLGSSQTITLQEVQELIINLNSKNSQKIRPKENILKELLFHYFQDLKKNLVSSLQRVYKSMSDCIQYPYLYQMGLCSVFKKLNSPELKKISPQDLHKIYQFNLQNTTLIRQKKQKQCYIQNTLRLQKVLQAIKNAFQTYSSQISQFDSEIVQSEGLYKKISNVINAIKQKNVNSQQDSTLQTLNKQKHQILNEKPLLQVPKRNKDLKVSFDVSNQISTFINHKNNPQNLQKTLQKSSSMREQQQVQGMSEKQKQRLNKRKFLLNQMKHLNQQIDKIESKSHQDMYQREQQQDKLNQNNNQDSNQDISQKSNKLRQNNENYKIKISQIKNQKQKKMKNLQPSDSKQKIRKLSQSLMTSPFQSYNQKQIKKVWKQCTSENISQQDQQIDNAALPHPFDNKQPLKKSYSYDAQERKPKRFKLPVEGLGKNLQKDQIDEIQSPIIRKKAQKQKNQFKLAQKKANNSLIHLTKVKTLDEMVDHVSEQVNQEQILQQSSQSDYQNKVQDFSDDEIKSLALFTQSLKLNPQQAIYLLRSALIYCPQNLSAAEYLSFLLLQQNQPKQCLQICNNVIQKISVNNCNKKDYFSIHIINNKAAALNQLGRFSQTISLLQRCHQIHQQQSKSELIFKNLGDAYFSLGIHQKAASNYEKSIKINPKYDEAIYNLAVCFYIQSNYKQCNKWITKACQLNPFKSQYKELLQNCKGKR